MDIRDFSSQFSVFVYTTNVDLGASTKVYLSQAGYEAFYFQDLETLFDRMRDSAPHILVFTTTSLEGSLSDFVNQTQEINDEIRFIAVSAVSQFDILAQYNSFGFVDVISDDEAAFEERVVWATDRACEKLYLTYQNEQLYDDLLGVKSTLESLEKEIAMRKPENKPAPLSSRIANYKAASSKEDMLQHFLKQIPAGALCIYFKFLPSVRSFVATHSQGLPASDIQGVGVQLESEDMKKLSEQVTLGQLPVRFSQMLKEAFGFNPPKALPLYAAQSFEGVFVFSGSIDAEVLAQINEEFSLLTLCYANFALEKKVDSLEVQDFVTELFNRNYYLKALEGEVSRAHRLKQPLSVVKLSIDDLFEIESSLGEPVRDALLKAVATVANKTSRTNDITCRTAANEISLILPHCSRKGAALRAERLRRIIESSQLLESELKVSVSLGISEYPTLCDSAKTLDESATKALLHITDKGGNKICLFKAPNTHKPDFEVVVE